MVFVDVSPRGSNDTTMDLRDDAVADNPIRALSRRMTDKAVNTVEARLTVTE